MVKKAFIGRFDKLSLIKAVDCQNVKVIGDPLGDYENITYKDGIQYKYYYKWLQELNPSSLLVVNNCLKSTVRGCLEYNCIRHYCKQAGNVLVFNDLPLINAKEDFYILYDFIQPNPWNKEEYSAFAGVECDYNFNLQVKRITTTDAQKAKYEELKRKTAAEVKKDPYIIPRRLLKYAESLKPAGFDSLSEFKENMRVCVSDLKVDEYFFNELQRKIKEAEDLCRSILMRQF